jgi:hypothetical protein
MFGLGRTTEVHCTECGHVVKDSNAGAFARKNYPQSIADAIKNLRATHKRTTWQLIYPWSFWFVFAALMGAILIGAKISSKKQLGDVAEVKEILSDPQPGDVYKSTWMSGDAAGQPIAQLVKVVRISGDTMVVVVSNKGFDLMQNPYDIKQWNKISDSDFDSKEYKLYLSDFKAGAIYFEYGNEENGNHKTNKGNVLGNGNMNLDFDVMERK